MKFLNCEVILRWTKKLYKIIKDVEKGEILEERRSTVVIPIAFSNLLWNFNPEQNISNSIRFGIWVRTFDLEGKIKLASFSKKQFRILRDVIRNSLIHDVIFSGSII